MTIKIFSIYHKQSEIFKTDVIEPIQTGCNFTDLDLGVLKDNTEQNIGDKNPYYAEMTAWYWVWKNYIKQTRELEYIGFCHYRRLLDFNTPAQKKRTFTTYHNISKFSNNYKEAYCYSNIYDIINGYDIILPELHYFEKKEKTVYEQFVDNHPKEEIDKLINIIRTDYPDYVQDMEEYLNGTTGYFCLNYVMRTPLFDEFMTWTFDLLDKMDKITNWEKYTDYLSQKTPAYLMERFFNVWLRHKVRVHDIKVLEREGILLSTETNTENGIDKRVYKIMPFVKIKHHGTQRILDIAGVKFKATKTKSNIGKSVLKIGKLRIKQLSNTAKKFQTNYVPENDIKLVATLLVRDEIDIIEENIKFHLNSGVDFIIATDNGSVDGTREVLLKYQELGKLKLIDEPEQNYNQVKWVDRMIRIAKDEYNADWVINLDADEFWLSDMGDLKKDLRLLNKYNVIYIPSLFMAPQNIGENKPFYHNTQGEFKSLLKVIHKTKGYQKIEMGSHDVHIKNKKTTYYNGITLFHYFVRSYEQFEHKVKLAGEALLKNKNRKKDEGKQILYYYDLYKINKLKDIYMRNFINNKNIKYIKNSKMLDYYENNHNSLQQKIHKILEDTECTADLLI